MKYCLLFCLAFLPIFATTPSPLLLDEPHEIIVYNRILAKVNEKSISVIDVMKKMDMFLQRYYPTHAQSTMARYQYFSKQWKETLSQMIDQELMLADAQHLEVKVTDGEVREEVLRRFGPNIMAVLDSIGVSYEEARSQVHNELIVQRIMWYRVHSKALHAANPQEIKEAYNLYCKENSPVERWRYQVLSIRALERQIAETIAQRVFSLLENTRVDLATLSSQLKTDEENASITLSAELEGDEKNLSESHKSVLKNLKPGTFSAPIAQTSRTDQSVVFRIFFLKEHQREELPSFEKMAEELKEKLLEQAVAKESVQYITKLRERLGYDEKHMREASPADFQPFVLKD